MEETKFLSIIFDSIDLLFPSHTLSKKCVKTLNRLQSPWNRHATTDYLWFPIIDPM